MEFVDKILKCVDCSGDFIFTAGEQLFFFDKQFKNDPKRCKPCKSKRAGGAARAGATGPAAAGISRTETRTECSECQVETTVPFKPTQGRPVLCRQCFQAKRVPTTGALVTASETVEMIKTGVGAGLGSDMGSDMGPDMGVDMGVVSAELVAAAAQAPQA